MGEYDMLYHTTGFRWNVYVDLTKKLNRQGGDDTTKYTIDGKHEGIGDGGFYKLELTKVTKTLNEAVLYIKHWSIDENRFESLSNRKIILFSEPIKNKHKKHDESSLIRCLEDDELKYLQDEFKKRNMDVFLMDPRN